MMSSASAEWFTPPEILQLVERLGPVALDPCWAPGCAVRARTVYTAEAVAVAPDVLAGVDGLKLPWDVPGLCFVNPPYGRGIGEWTSRCRTRVARRRLAGFIPTPYTETVALVPARVDTQWFQDDCVPGRSANAVCFLRGRVRFADAKALAAGWTANPAPFPSAVVYYGPRVETFCSIFNQRGAMWT
jgi:hypothetical protein